MVIDQSMKTKREGMDWNSLVGVSSEATALESCTGSLVAVLVGDTDD